MRAKSRDSFLSLVLSLPLFLCLSFFLCIFGLQHRLCPYWFLFSLFLPETQAGTHTHRHTHTQSHTGIYLPHHTHSKSHCLNFHYLLEGRARATPPQEEVCISPSCNPSSPRVCGSMRLTYSSFSFIMRSKLHPLTDERKKEGNRIWADIYLKSNPSGARRSCLSISLMVLPIASGLHSRVYWRTVKSTITLPSLVLTLGAGTGFSFPFFSPLSHAVCVTRITPNFT